MQDEAPGFALLEALDGRGAARIFARQNAAVLMEWLAGPSLGDVVRGGDNAGATHLLGEVAQRILGADVRLDGLPKIGDEFQALFDLRFGTGCRDSLRCDVERARGVARQMLASMTEVRPLHRDLHHDNIKKSDRGWLAFDAKGALGDPAYELANAFRNPLGAEDLWRQAQRMRFMAGLWAKMLSLPRDRLIGWAVAHMALSITWDVGDVLEDHRDADVLGVFLSVWDEVGRA